MMVFEVDEKLAGKWIAVSSARDVRVISDVGTEAKHPYGFSPAEMIGSALASCILINAQKMAPVLGIDFSSMEIKVKVYRDEGVPRITKLEYVFLVGTEAHDEKLKALNERALKYSTTYNTLKDSVDISGTIEKSGKGT